VNTIEGLTRLERQQENFGTIYHSKIHSSTSFAHSNQSWRCKKANGVFIGEICHVASCHAVLCIRGFIIDILWGFKLLVCNNLEVNNIINLLYKTLFKNWIFKWYFISLSIIEFMNHFEFMTEIVKLHNIEYTLKNH
jgi:hypothetical protein